MADSREGYERPDGASIPHHEENDLWDRLRLGPNVMPGVWAVRGPGIGRRLDKKRSKGQDGARVKDLGYELADLEFVGRFVSRSQWDDVVKAAKLLSPRRRGVAMEPLEVDHPALTYLGVTAVTISGIGVPTIDRGFYICSFRAVEWMPKPKPKPEATDVPQTKHELEWAARQRAGVPPSAVMDQLDVQSELAQLIALSDLGYL